MAGNDPTADSPRGSLPIPKSRRGAKGFLTEVGREMKKVNWPTRTETTRLTGVVLAVCIMGIVVLTVMSTVFAGAITLITTGSLR